MSTAPSEITLHIQPSAVSHFQTLIEAENQPDLGLRLFLDHPGSPQAEVGITFCPKADAHPSDLEVLYPHFVLYVDKASVPFLQEASIDFQEDALGGQLAITAPNIKGPKPDEDAPLSVRIEHVLQTEVNPNLAQHGGHVSLVTLTDALVAILQFGGGCQGCGMADVTLKQGIERTLKEHFPMLTGVQDRTDHASGDNPYYQ